MKQIVITCIDSSVSKRADVLSKSDKHMRVVLINTTVTLDLHRTDVRDPYRGRLSSLEFECHEV